MAVYKKHWDGLPKIGLDELNEKFEVGDTIFEVMGYSGDYRGTDIIMFTLEKPGIFSFYNEDLVEKGRIIKRQHPYDFQSLVNYMRDRKDKVLEAINNTFAIQMGDRIIRYKLLKKDDSLFEILT